MISEGVFSQDSCQFQQKILTSVTTDLQGVGVSDAVGVYGDWTIIGAYGDSENGPQSGAAYFYRRCGSQWEQVQRVIPEDSEEADRFGRGVAIYGDYAVVGAPYDDDANNNSGAAYIYHLENNVWVQQTKIVATDADPSDWFGWTVDIWQDYVLIGCKNDDGISSFTGSAYLYKREGGNWVFKQNIKAPDEEQFDQFGYSLDMNDSLVVIGAYENDEGALLGGAAYVYEFSSGDTVVFRTKVIASDVAEGDNFGTAVSISSDRLLVGSPYRGETANSSEGAVYVYENDGNDNWIETSIQYSPTAISTTERYGTSVSQYGNRVLVGNVHGFGISEETGTAYLYNVNNGTWEYTMELYSLDGEHADFFSRSMDIYEDIIVLGAMGDDSNGGNAGSAYMFYVECEPLCTKIIAPNVGDTMYHPNDSIRWAADSLASGFMLAIGTTPGGDDILTTTDVGDVYAYYLPLDDQQEYFVTIVPYNDYGQSTQCEINNFYTEYVQLEGTLAGDVTINCDEDIPEAIVNYSNHCGMVETNLTEEITSQQGEGCYTITRTLVVSDPCFTDTTTQQILVTDNVAPEIIDNVEILNVECGGVIPLTEPTAVDNCGEVTITYTDSGNLDCGSTITRTFTITDDCGNIATINQMIVIAENSNPPGCTDLLSPVGLAVGLGESLVWNAIAGADGYILDIGTTSGGTDILSQQDVGNEVSYAPGAWPLASTIYVQITPYNEFGQASGCSEFQFETVLVGINEFGIVENDFLIYPNPSNDGIIQLEINSSNRIETKDIEIYDMTGRRIDVEITSSNSAQGVNRYTLKVEASTGYFVMRVQKEGIVYRTNFGIIE